MWLLNTTHNICAAHNTHTLPHSPSHSHQIHTSLKLEISLANSPMPLFVLIVDSPSRCLWLLALSHGVSFSWLCELSCILVTAFTHHRLQSIYGGSLLHQLEIYLCWLWICEDLAAITLICVDYLLKLGFENCRMLFCCLIIADDYARKYCLQQAYECRGC